MHCSSKTRLLRRPLGLAAALLLLLGPRAAGAQSSSVSGFVVDAASGAPLELATVALRPDGGEARGAITNKDGSYLIPRLNAGRYVFQVTYVGYETYTDTLQLAAGQRTTVSVRLTPLAESLDEVVVQSERTTGAARVTAGQQTIRPADIALVPAPDVSADLVSYLTTMPGIVSTGDRGGQLFIRGGEPWQNLVEIDGMTLYQPFHILGFYSAFPAEIINRTDIYAGGYGSRFSGRISSVIDVSTRTGNNRRFGGTASLSPFVSAAHIEGPIIPGKVSLLGSVRQSVIQQGIEPLLGEPMPFHFGDMFGKLHADLSATSRLSATYLHTFDRGALAEETSGRTLDELRWQNTAYGVRYLVMPKLLPVVADLHVSYSQLGSEQGPEAAPVRTSEINNTRVSLDATFFRERGTVEAGWKAEVINLGSELGGLFQNTFTRNSKTIHMSAYLEPELQFGALKVRPGISFQHTEVLPASFEPRLRMVLAGRDQQLSAAVGLYRQEILGLNDRRDATSVFTAWALTPSKTARNQQDLLAGNVPEAWHFILGYRAEPAPWLELSLEGYHKILKHLFVPEWTAFPQFTTRLQPADGRSSGFDARAEVRRGPFYTYVNYGLSFTRYNAQQETLELWYGRESLDFRPPHDRRHQVNGLVSMEALGATWSAHWEFGSGLPYSQALGFDGFILMNGLVDVGQQGSQRVIYASPFNAVLPTYHRLDLSAERSFRIGAADLTLQGSLINSYDRRNLFYLDIFTLQRVDQLPLIPSLGIKVAFE